MKRITIYRHKDCAKCAKIARVHKFFDWLNRVQTSTDTPKTGPLQLGEIAVEDAQTGEMTKGVEAVRQICRHIPAYAPFLPLLRIPFIARRVEAEVRGCADGRCVIPRDEAPERTIAADTSHHEMHKFS
ncbi:MAG: hypothetical protein IRY99_17480 [Isosphaeraceae bacterium]|nr:hypothetical protein [Isosphaeraceae bacterium]